MIATFETRPTRVKALQLTPETAAELIRWTNGYILDVTRWIPQERCWRVSALRFYPTTFAAPDFLHAMNALMVGIRTRQGEAIVHEGCWVVQPSGAGGGFQIFSADRFHDDYVRSYAYADD